MTKTTTDEQRKQFEQSFPPPAHVEWDGDEYTADPEAYENGTQHEYETAVYKAYNHNLRWETWKTARTGDEVKCARENGEDDGFDRAVNCIEPGFGLLINSLGFDGDYFDGDEDGAFIINKALAWFSELLKPFCFVGTDDEGRLITRTGGEVEASKMDRLSQWVNSSNDFDAQVSAFVSGFEPSDTTSLDSREQQLVAHAIHSFVRDLVSARPAPSAAVPNGYAILPKELTAENGAKALLMGEYSVGDFIQCGLCDNGNASVDDDEFEACELCDGQGGHHVSFAVDWTTIKEIWRKAADHLTADPQPKAEEK